MKNEPMTTGKIAKYCHVTYRAVLKWIEEGKLKGYRTPGQHCRVRIEDFMDFLQKYNMPIPPEFDPSKWRKRVLIVDDDKNIVELIQRELTLDNKYKCEVAHDGFTAGEKFSEFQPDLVILDIQMPGLNGYEVCAHIRHNLKNKAVKILAISGLSGQEDREKMIKTGANDFVAKPFEVSKLKKKIEKLLGLITGENDEDVLDEFRR